MRKSTCFLFQMSLMTFLFTISCNEEKKTIENPKPLPSKDQSLSTVRILQDISELDISKYEDFFETDFYQNIQNDTHTSDISYRKFFQEDQCLIHFGSEMTSSVIPVQYDDYNHLLLFYYRDQEDTSIWSLDTVVTTFPIFEQIKENTHYYKARADRCVLGYCHWYDVILQIEGTQITEVFEYYGEVRSMRLEYYLMDDNPDPAHGAVGDTVDYTREIEKYNWEGTQLKSILLKNEVSVLKEVIDDSLVLRTTTFDRLIEL